MVSRIEPDKIFLRNFFSSIKCLIFIFFCFLKWSVLSATEVDMVGFFTVFLWVHLKTSLPQWVDIWFRIHSSMQCFDLWSYEWMWSDWTPVVSIFKVHYFGFIWSYLSNDIWVGFEISTRKFPVYRKIWAHKLWER